MSVSDLFQSKLNELNRMFYISMTGYSRSGDDIYYYTLDFKDNVLVFTYFPNTDELSSKKDEIKFIFKKVSKQLIIIDFSGDENCVDNVEKLIYDIHDKKNIIKKDGIVQYLLGTNGYNIEIYKR